MTEFTVTGIPGSPFVRAALLVLEEKGAPYRLDALAFGAQRSPEYLRLQPFGKIPAFAHGDFAFYETQAFLRYVDRMVPEPALVPSDAKAIARMDQLIGIADDYLKQQVSGAVTFPLGIAPKLGMPADRAAGEAAIPAAAHVLDVLAGLLGDQQFLVGDRVTLADLMIVPHLDFLPSFDEGRALIQAQPRLAAWLARMQARPSMQATSWERLLETSGMQLPEPVAA
jgi:glutathione S-transferase